MTPSRCDQIVGVRCFQLRARDAVLKSVFVDHRYDRRKVVNAEPPSEGGHGLRTAKPRSRSRAGRGLLDERGFYAVKPEAMSGPLHRLLRRDRRLSLAACGVVRLFGTVVEHQRGYRAQGLLIDRLAVLNPEVAADVDVRLKERYRVPVDRPKGGRVFRRAETWARFWLDELWGIEVAPTAAVG